MSVEAKRNGNIVELDVREMLEVNNDPFNVIMKAVETLKPDDKFVLHAIFKPMPLLRVLEGKGYSNQIEELAENHWKITFTKGV